MSKPYVVKLSPSAIEDLKEAYNWHESRLSEGLGHRFLKQVDKSMLELSIVPSKGSIRYANIRCTMVNKFPYLIHYEINDKTNSIIIYRIFCTFRKPLWE